MAIMFTRSSSNYWPIYEIGELGNSFKLYLFNLMNSIDFNELELTPLNESDVQEIEGGIWKEIALVIFGGAVADWANFKKGFVDGLSAN